MCMNECLLIDKMIFYAKCMNIVCVLCAIYAMMGDCLLNVTIMRYVCLKTERMHLRTAWFDDQYDTDILQVQSVR